MDDCIFCKIVSGAIPSKRLYEDDSCIAFEDIHPQAPTHILVIPKVHLSSLAHTSTGDAALLGHLLHICAQVAQQAGLQQGYRVVTNIGEHGAQSVEHLHLHVLGGRQLTGSMG